MKRLNVFDDSRLDIDDPADAPEHFNPAYVSLRDHIGAEKLAASLVVLERGQAVCPYHAELIEEEWLLVLAGTPTVRTPGGEQTLQEGDLLCFPRGPAGAHRIANQAPGPARVLILAERAELAATVYEDSDKIGIFGPDLRMLFRRSDQRDYYDGE